MNPAGLQFPKSQAFLPGAPTGDTRVSPRGGVAALPPAEPITTFAILGLGHKLDLQTCGWSAVQARESQTLEGWVPHVTAGGGCWRKKYRCFQKREKVTVSDMA